MITLCHPQQLGGRHVLDTPPELRGTFEFESPHRLVADDHLAHGGASWIVNMVEWDGSGIAHATVRYNGKHRTPEPYYEPPYGT